MGTKVEEKNEFFEDLKAGLQAAIEHASGGLADHNASTTAEGAFA
jgi:hypothetical protein